MPKGPTRFVARAKPQAVGAPLSHPHASKKPLPLPPAYRDEKGPAAALPYHQRAIELDPNFAMGYLVAGNDYARSRRVRAGQRLLHQGIPVAGTCSEREKLAITATYYLSVTGELDKAAQTYQEEIESYPRNPGAHLDLGIVYSAQGQPAK
jgi:tetratricopeptide (TPR) repeat protein